MRLVHSTETSAGCPAHSSARAQQCVARCAGGNSRRWQLLRGERPVAHAVTRRDKDWQGWFAPARDPFPSRAHPQIVRIAPPLSLAQLSAFRAPRHALWQSCPRLALLAPEGIPQGRGHAAAPPQARARAPTSTLPHARLEESPPRAACLRLCRHHELVNLLQNTVRSCCPSSGCTVHTGHARGERDCATVSIILAIINRDSMVVRQKDGTCPTFQSSRLPARVANLPA